MAEASIEELKAALRPFAVMVTQLSKTLDDDEIVIMSLMPPPKPPGDPLASTIFTPPFPVTVGDVRRAAYLLGLLARLEGKLDSERVFK